MHPATRECGGYREVHSYRERGRRQGRRRCSGPGQARGVGMRWRKNAARQDFSRSAGACSGSAREGLATE